MLKNDKSFLEKGMVLKGIIYPCYVSCVTHHTSCSSYHRL